MGYAAQFNLLSPCYKAGEQPASDFRIGGAKTNSTKKGKKATTVKKSSTKKGKSSKQRGGSSCGASLSVAEMGVVDKPASNQPTGSELAWDNRMKGGDPNGNVVSPPPTGNLLSSTSIITTNKNKSVNSKNSPLNKIKNDLFPEGTTPELVMKIIETYKNSTNPAESTYSFEIFYRENGQNDIQKSSQSNVKYGQFFAEYRNISEKVFPRPPKNKNSVGLKPKTNANSQTQANANAKAKAKANANSQTQANANSQTQANAKAKANANANAQINSLFNK